MPPTRLPKGKDRFTVAEALLIVQDASHDPLRVLDVFVEVQTDQQGGEYHPAGGEVATSFRLSDKGLLGLHIAREAFMNDCAALGIRPFSETARRSYAHGMGIDLDACTITADELVRYAESQGIALLPADTERPTADAIASPPGHVPAPEPKGKRKGKRTDNLKRAIFDAWKNGLSISSSASETFDYLVLHDATGLIRGRDGDELSWENTSGELSRTRLAKLSDRLTAYRKEYNDAG